MSENNSLAEINPRDVVVAKPEDINKFTQEVSSMESITRDAVRELSLLDEALESFEKIHNQYRDKSYGVRRKMNELAKKL